MTMKKKDLISIRDLEVGDILQLFDRAAYMKAHRQSQEDHLRGKSVALIFQKPSNRTRVSFEAGVSQLGGNAIYLGPDDIKLGKREAVKDVACTLAQYVDGIVARTFAHADVVDLARHAHVPVINGLSDLEHPCQALADVLTIRERFADLRKVTVAFVGDANNVLNSLAFLCARLGIGMRIATPPAYALLPEVVAQVKGFALASNAPLVIGTDPREAVAGADIIYTDVWVSMGQEKERGERLEAFGAFQVNESLLSAVKKKRFYVMHCLPAHRGEEITDGVIDGERSIVFDQAENRLHIQKAILSELIG